MALNIIYGRAGTGKTDFCLEKIKNSLSDNIIIVPEQTSLSTERLAVQKLGYLGRNCDVLSFNRLFHRLYMQENGRKREYISSIGKTLIINRLLSENKDKLSVFKNAEKHASISGQILATFSEFKRHGVTFDSLKKAGTVLTGKAALKIADLSFLYKAYTEEIEKYGCDSEDNLALLSQLIADTKSIKNTCFYIDGFSSFTSVELSVIKALIENSDNVYVTLTCSYDNTFLFEPAISTKEKLKTLVSPALLGEDIILKENKKHSLELKFLEKNYYSFSSQMYESRTEDILVFNADNPYSECDMCSWQIYNLVKNEGYHFGDIAVISTNTELYNDILEDAFKRYEIDYYMDEKTSISTHPLCSLFIGLCNVCISNFAKNDIINLLKSGFFDLDFEEISILEQYLSQTGIKGKQWQSQDNWDYLSDKYDIDRINNIRTKVSDIILPFKNKLSGGKNAEEFCEAIEVFCKDINLLEKVEKISEQLYKDGELQKSVACEVVLKTIYDSLSQFKACMNTSKITLRKFKDMLFATFAQSKIGSIPISSDRVITGGFADSRLSSIKVLFILGATDNALPGPVSGTGIITDNERRIFEKNNINLAPDNKKKALEQPLKLYSLLTVPSQKLIISYPNISESGKALEQAEVITDIKELFVCLTQKNASERTLDSLITTKKASLHAFANKENSTQKELLCKWFEEKHGKFNSFNKVLSARYYRLSDSIREETAKILYHGKINATVSRLEQFAKCPFSFFAKYGLNLNEKQTSKYQVTDAGTFMHRILECFTSYIIENKIPWDKITKEESDKIADMAVQTSVNEIMEKFPLMDKRQNFFMNRMKNSGMETAWTIVRHIQSGKMRPLAVEYKLKDNLTPFVVTTPNGNELTLYGTVDRIDGYEDKFRIIDYKSSSKDLDLAKVYEGHMLQLFLYSAAMRKKNGEPAGMFYLTLSVPEVEYKTSDDAEVINETLYKSRKMSGYMVGDEKIAEMMDENYLKSDVINVKYVKKRDSLDGNILSKNEYELLEKQAVKNASNFGDRILGGEISPSPCITGLGTSCTYCSFSPVCGFEEASAGFRKPLKITKEEIFEKLREEDTNEK